MSVSAKPARMEKKGEGGGKVEEGGGGGVNLYLVRTRTPVSG